MFVCISVCVMSLVLFGVRITGIMSDCILKVFLFVYVNVIMGYFVHES